MVLAIILVGGVDVAADAQALAVRRAGLGEYAIADELIEPLAD